MNSGHDNLIPAKPGEVRNPNGRPVGSLNRSTIARKWLETQERFKNPITKVEELLTEEDIMTLGLIKKARAGDVQAYRALMDSAYGAPKQPIELDDISEKQRATYTLPDGTKINF